MRTKERRIAYFGQEARTKLLSGVEQTAKAVACTLGPKGRHVVIELQYQLPHVTKDGVSVAREFALADPLENMGSHMLQEAANKAAYYAGDGTTTATVLGHAIVRNVFREIKETRIFGIKVSSNKDVNLIEVKKGIDQATIDIVSALKSLATKATPEMVIHVATVSANGDKVIGKIVGDAVNSVGAKGAITIEESESNENKLSFSEGYQLDSGWFDVAFVNNPRTMGAEFEDAKILIVDETLSKIKDMDPFFKAYDKTTGPLIIVANGFQGEVLASMIETKKQLNSPICLVKAPSIGEYRQNFLKDLALFTGGKVLGDEHTHRIRSFKMEMMGTAAKVIINQNKATFSEGGGEQDKIDDQIIEIENLSKEASESTGKHLMARSAALQAKVANIEVSSGSSIQLREMMDRLDDSIKAARASIDEGVLIGGGSALVKCLKMSKSSHLSYSYGIGYDALLEALKEPLTQICLNCGVNPEAILSQVFESPSYIGYNAMTEEMGNLFEEGIVDPLKVTRIALESASSVAAAIITTECVLAFAAKPKSENEPPNPYQ